jgi:hypothetical protein
MLSEPGQQANNMMGKNANSEKATVMNFFIEEILK